MCFLRLILITGSKNKNIFFKIFYLFIFRVSGSEGERKRETLLGCLLYAPLPGIKPETQACALTRNPTDNPLLCKMTPNQLSYTSQGKK